jgi:hypothetical protein
MEQPMFRLIICCLVLGASSPAWATTRYVDGNLPTTCAGSTYSVASRNCSGTDGPGYKTMPEGWRAAQHGDLVLHRAGSYTLSYGTFGDTYGGTGSDWATATTFTNYPGETVTVNGGANFDNAIVATSYVIITADVRGHFVFDPGGFRVNNGVHHIRFEKLVILNAAQHGIQGGTGCSGAFPANIEILNNEIRNGGHVSNQDHGIYPACSQDWLVRGNYLVGNQAVGIHFNAGGVANQHIRPIIEYNWIEGMKAGGVTSTYGLFVNSANDAIIRRNVIVGLGAQSVRFSGCYQIGATTVRPQIYNNTCYDTTITGIFVGTTATNALVQNNIFNTRLSVPIDNQGPSSTLTTNHCEVADTGCSVTGSAGFVSAGTNFALAAGSTAINVGTAISGVPYNGSAPDIGAFESGGAPADVTPPAAPKVVQIQ